MFSESERDEFVDNYLDELNENIQRIDGAVLSLKKDPANEDALNLLLRALHTIKGSSRMLKFNHVEAIVHGLENVFKGIREKRYDLSRPLIQLVFIATDHLRRAAGKIRSENSDDIPGTALLSIFDKVCANEPFSLERLKSAESDADAAPMEPSPAVEDASLESMDTSQFKPRVQEYETIRVKLSRMEKIISQFNTLVLNQFHLKKEWGLINELEADFKELMAVDANGSNGPDRLRHRKLQLTCLKRIRTLRKNFTSALCILEQSTLAARDEIYSLRMLPMSLILTPLEKMVAELAMTLDKEIDCTIQGGDILLDKLILEKLHDPLIHIVRNAIDHGLEAPDIRRGKGKPPAGKLRIDCYPESGSIIVKVSDDGRGLDYSKIREKAVAQNPLQADEIRTMDPAKLNMFIFSPGFSTTDVARDLSGRGMGLDIVRCNIEQVKGRISLESSPDKGTTFILSLPLSLATVEGFFVSAGGETFLIPANFINEIAIVENSQRMAILDRWAVKLHGKVIPVYPLAAALGRSWDDEPGDRIFVVVVESLGEMVGIRVDSVIQFASLIHKPLPKGLSAMNILQGVVFDENYNIVSILYIPQLMRRFKSIRDIETRRKFSADRRENKRVLVVDDSYSAREIQRSILELEDYAVETAGDGIEGLDQLKEQRFHLIITDIKMPRMDGLTFVENLRRDDQHGQTPVIVVSSVDDPEIRRQFTDRGADAFIVKSEFDRGNLVQAVRSLIG